MRIGIMGLGLGLGLCLSVALCVVPAAEARTRSHAAHAARVGRSHAPRMHLGTLHGARRSFR